MYLIVFSARAKKALRKYGKSGSFPEQKFEQALQQLRSQGVPPLFYKDHQLSGDLSNYREFHLASDILVQYEKDDNLRCITIAKIGTHNELFGG